MAEHTTTPQGREIAARVEKFVREVIVPFERDQRWTSHGPSRRWSMRCEPARARRAS